MELWKRLKFARELAGLNQRELAEHFGVSRGAITQWENPPGKKQSIPTVDKFPKLAKVCDVDLIWLLTGEGMPRPIPGVSQDVLEAIPDMEKTSEGYQRDLVKAFMRALEENAIREDDARIISSVIDAARKRRKAANPLRSAS